MTTNMSFECMLAVYDDLSRYDGAITCNLDDSKYPDIEAFGPKCHAHKGGQGRIP